MRLWAVLLMGVIGLTLSLLLSSAAVAQAPQYFYCFATNAGTGTVYMSDIHEVGPISERRSYGEQFAKYLIGKGKVPVGTDGYCVMRPTKAEIERGQSELSSRCDRCGDANKFEQTAWIRDGKRGTEALLAGKLIKETPAAPDEARTLPENRNTSIGAYLWVRTDAADAVLMLNEANAPVLGKLKTDLRGGHWRPLLHNERCAGWASIAYATNGEAFEYVVARGQESEGAANALALARAEEIVRYRGGDWMTALLRSYRNEFENRLDFDFSPPTRKASAGPPSTGETVADALEGVVEGLKGAIYSAYVSDCPSKKNPFPKSRFVTVGVRG